MSAPSISVLLCNYNYGRFIGQAIESVLAQTFSDFELIIVDDASTDDSRAVIAGYDDPRIHCHHHATNQGQAAAFNTAFAAARGDWIALLDSDDWWTPDKLATLARWRAVLPDTVALWQHGLNVQQPDGQTWAYRRILASGDAFTNMRLTGVIDYFMPTSALAFPRAVLAQIMPIPAGLRIAADAYLTRCAIALGPVYAEPGCLGTYRKHDNAVLGNTDFDVDGFFVAAFAHINAFYRRQGIDFQFDPALRRPSGNPVQLTPPGDDIAPLRVRRSRLDRLLRKLYYRVIGKR